MKQVHLERSEYYFSVFVAEWEEVEKRDAEAMATVDRDDTHKSGAHIRHVLTCARFTMAGSTPDQSLALKDRLQSFLYAVRSLLDVDVVLPSVGDTRVTGMSGAYDGNDSASAMLKRIRVLPSRMTETFGRPETVEDVRDALATLSAFAVLDTCCSASLASNEIGAAWVGMAIWLVKIPDHFLDLVSCHNPAALVVLAHWATSLVRWAERCGCWFLDGSAEMILRQIEERLPADNRAVGSLVADLGR